MEIPNHKRRITTSVPNGIAALECSPHRMRFMTKKIMKIVPVIKPEVRIVFDFHASPPNVL